MKQQDFAKNRV